MSNKNYFKSEMKPRNRGRLADAERCLSKVIRAIENDDLDDDSALEEIADLVYRWQDKRWPGDRNASDLEMENLTCQS
jgi:hypothetical protein